jgi:hypothetical protein
LIPLSIIMKGGTTTIRSVKIVSLRSEDSVLNINATPNRPWVQFGVMPLAIRRTRERSFAGFPLSGKFPPKE